MRIKDFNKKCIVFIFAVFFVISGIFTENFAYSILSNTFLLVDMDISVEDYINNIEKGSAKNLSYYGTMMNANSFLTRLTGSEIVKKDDKVVVKLDNSYLAYQNNYVEDKTIEFCVNNLNNLYESSISNDAEFLYVLCPVKGYNDSFPDCIKDYTRDNYDRLSKAINKKHIPMIDLQKESETDGMTTEDLFFITDHHWLPETGFWAYQKICKILEEKYCFDYNEEYIDINNYNIKRYSDWFLGSQGKKVGKYFTPLGIDDIDLITPKFNTHLVEEQPLRGESREGSFLDSVIYMDNLEKKDLYKRNPYAAYSGGDFRIQIIKNSLKQNGKKMLVVRDSFACCVTPFLSLQLSELHILDIREGDSYFGNKANVSEYIEKIKPDYVLVIYNGAGGESYFNFN